MCKFCENKKLDPPKLPYFTGVIHDYQTSVPEMVLNIEGKFIHIPIKCCPECGRKLGKKEEK